KDGKMIFFGAMIAEGIVALIWAAVAMSFFGGIRELGEVMSEEGHNAAWVVNEICNSLLGKIGGVLAIIGVVAAPITSGDTAFRSARLTIADSFKIKQNSLTKRLLVTIPIFAIGLLLTQINFGVIWRYFGWANQTLATIVLWAAAVYMLKTGSKFWFVLIPAAFMTAVTTTYILVAPEGFQLPYMFSYITGTSVALVLMGWFLINNFKTNFTS
ncbi:MAG: carbon starvation protein A, partial [Bacteroidales bacterium]|nr:carbon starvation protein A [Bacteroidales bacterium]